MLCKQRNVAEDVLVNGERAIYIRGAWDREMVWHSDSDLQTLAWASGGFAFMLQGSDLDLSREEFIVIAEGIE